MDRIVFVYDTYFETLKLQSEYNTLFMNSIHKDTFNKLNNNYVSKEQEMIFETTQTENKTVSKNLKKLYKKIALSTHPDKSKESDIIFSDVKEAYTTGTISLLMYYSFKKKIPIMVDDSDIEIIDRELNLVEIQIQDIKESVCWKWYHGNEKTKNDIINKIKEQYS